MLGLCLAPCLPAQLVTNVFNTSGSFLVPAGVTQVTVEAWGGGGGGRVSVTTDRRAGGGGGAYARSLIPVVPGNSYNYVVGAGGTAGDPGGNGGNSSWDDGSLLLAIGGTGAFGNTGGSGGAAASSVGNQATFSGGNGGNRGTNNGGGGGGGGSAFTNANGGNGSAGTTTGTGAGGTGTGAGGAGGVPPSGAGQNGLAPGGGGGGASENATVAGNGAAGRIRVIYSIPGPPAKLAFSTPARTTNIDKSSALITVQIQDAFNNVVSSVGTTTINLSSSGTGEFRNASDSAVITSVSIPNGNSDASFRYRAATVGSRTLTVAATGLTSANQAISIVNLPPVAQTFYLPIPEAQLLTALQTINTTGGAIPLSSSPIINRISLAVLSDNTVIYYDQSENDYEADLSNPSNIYSSPGNLAGT